MWLTASEPYVVFIPSEVITGVRRLKIIDIGIGRYNRLPELRSKRGSCGNVVFYYARISRLIKNCGDIGLCTVHGYVAFIKKHYLSLYI